MAAVFGAVSIAVLSFLGFDGISMLAEENKDEARAIGRSMVAALLLAGTLFIVQTWIAALLVPNPDELISKGDAGGTAFYDAAAAGRRLAGEADRPRDRDRLGVRQLPGGPGGHVAPAVRDGARPAAAVVPREGAREEGVPVNATLLTAVVSLVLGLYMASRDDGITLLSTLVNFGALSAFLVLHVSVVRHYVVRNGSRDWWRHVVLPGLGFAILLYVVINADVAAQTLGFVWLAIGVVCCSSSWPPAAARPRARGRAGRAGPMSAPELRPRPAGTDWAFAFGGRAPLLTGRARHHRRARNRGLLRGAVRGVGDLPSEVCTFPYLNPVTGPIAVEGAEPGNPRPCTSPRSPRPPGWGRVEHVPALRRRSRPPTPRRCCTRPSRSGCGATRARPGRRHLSVGGAQQRPDRGPPLDPMHGTSAWPRRPGRC